MSRLVRAMTTKAVATFPVRLKTLQQRAGADSARPGIVVEGQAPPE
jgi:hypothetical protein